MLVLVTVVAAASVARAQDKPRVGQDGRPLLNKPKVGGRINLCPYASKYWRFKSFILHFISPFTIAHLHK